MSGVSKANLRAKYPNCMTCELANTKQDDGETPVKANFICKKAGCPS